MTMHVTQKGHFKSVVAIDLGAKNTGIFMVQHQEGDYPTNKNTMAATLVMPEEGGGLVYSQKNRTAARHRLRSKKRFSLARRLMSLILTERFKQQGLVLPNNQRRHLFEAINGLLKRRGYSRIETEINLSVLEGLDPYPFAEYEAFTSFFNAQRNLLEQWEDLTGQMDQVSRFLKICPNKKDFESYMKQSRPEFKEQISDYVKALMTMHEDASSICMQVQMGHQHRSKYLQAIRKDMQTDSRLAPAVDGECQKFCVRGDFSEGGREPLFCFSDVCFSVLASRATPLHALLDA